MTVHSLAGLVGRLSTESRPLLTWYGRSGERVELSGPVLARWVAKTSHLLLDLDAEPGESVLVSLGPTWRAPVVWLAAWRLGLTVAVGSAGSSAGAAAHGVDLAVVPDGTPVPDGVDPDRVVVVAGGALATRAAALPDGAVDYAATVASFPDEPPPPGPAPDPAVLDPDGRATTVGEVLAGAGALAGARVWLRPEAGPADLAGAWAAGGSVVWHDGLPPDQTAHLAATENATPTP